MAFAQGSRSGLSYIAESTYGTTPAGNFTNLPYNTHSLNLVKGRVEGNEIQSDRIPRVDRHGNRQVNGDIVVDLRADDFDDLLEGVMFSDWDTSPSSAPDELKVGTTVKSFSFEDYAADIDQARVFDGCMISRMAVSIRPDQMVTTTFSVVGQDMTVSATEKTVDASSTNQPFDPFSGDLTLGDNGGSLTSVATITGIDFSIDNGLNPTFVIGSSTTPQLEYGRAVVEGTLTAYFEDASLINRFLNETETAFDVAVDDPTGGNEYKFYFPRVKFNGANINVDNPQSRLIQIPFVSIYDSTEGSNLVIYRPETA